MIWLAAQQPNSRGKISGNLQGFLFVPVIYTGHSYTTAAGLIVILCTVQFGIVVIPSTSMNLDF